MKAAFFKWAGALVLCTALVSGCAQKAEKPVNTAASPAVVDEKAGVKKMETISDQLNKLLDAKKDADIKKTAVSLEDEWSSFEDGVKKKFPDLYIAVEKDLSSLTAGSKATTLDYALLKKTNDSL